MRVKDMNGLKKIQEIAGEFYWKCEILEEGDKITILAHGFPQIVLGTKKDGEEFKEFKILTVDSEHYISLGGAKVGDTVNFERFVSVLEKARDRANFGWNVEAQIRNRRGNNEIGMF